MHGLTGEKLLPEELNKVCLTLATKNSIPNFGNMGYIYPFSPNNFVAMSSEDAGSWVIDKEKFVYNNFPSIWQFAEESGYENSKVFFESTKLSKLILPTCMEQAMVERDIDTTGEVLTGRFYSEIYATNKNKDLKPIGVFLKIDPLNPLTDEHLETAKKLADNLGVKPIIINKAIYREKHGLPALTKDEEELLSLRSKDQVTSIAKK